MIRKIFILVSIIFITQSFVYACMFDTDCAVGSKCVKDNGALYGVCVGGLSPGNRNDDQPAKFFPDLNKTHGDTCQFDIDCGPGSRCVKGSGSLYGTCMGG